MYKTLALSCCVIGTACLYLAAPKQQWLKASLPRMWIAPGVLLLIVAFWVWTQIMVGTAAFFVTVVLAMMLLTAYPYLGAAMALARKQTTQTSESDVQ